MSSAPSSNEALSRVIPRKLKVQHIITSLERGGAQQVLARLVRSTANEVTQEVITLLPPEPRAVDEYRNLGVRVEHIEVRGVRGAVGAVMESSRSIRRFAPDVIQGWMYHANVLASLASMRSGTKAALLWNIRHAAEASAKDALTTRILIRGARWFAGTVDAVVFNSNRSRVQHESLGYPAGKSVVVHNGFDLNRFTIDKNLGERWRVKNGFAESEILIGQAARYHPVKNHEGLLRAFAAAAPPNTRLVMVGDGVDSENTELTSLAASLGCTARVSLLGAENDMNAFYNAVDVLVSASHSEAFPNVVGEAMCCGRPCISTDVGDARELVGEAGWLIQPGQPNALRDALVSVIGLGRTGLSTYTEACRRHIEKRFGIQSMATNYLNLYGRVTSCGSSA